LRAEAVADGAWTMVVIPDTQYYVRNDADAAIFTEMTEWIVARREERNIQLVLHVGDIVNDNEPRQWEHAKRSLSVLDGEVPYVLAVGNHDLGRNARSRETMLNDYFSLADNPCNQRIFGGFFEQGALENAWYRFRHGKWDLLVFSLEFGPRKSVVDWADAVAARHRGLPAVLVTHEFIDHESTFSSDDGKPRRTTPSTTNNPHKYGISRGEPVHCGEELWDAFVSRHPGFRLVVNGHYKPFEKAGDGKLSHLRDLACAWRADPVDGGSEVLQMLFNAQWCPRGGEGWLRLLEFQPDGRSVKVRTFSPYLERTADDPGKAWRRTPGCEFEFQWSAPLRPE
jgi:predicted phosphodiesterase